MWLSSLAVTEKKPVQMWVRFSLSVSLFFWVRWGIFLLVTELHKLQSGSRTHKSWLVQGVWYTPGRCCHPATGFLEERLRNIRKPLHSRRSASGQLSQTTNKRRANVTVRITIFPDTEVSEADNNKMTEWLKKNKQVEEVMRGTAIYRAQWIRENGSKSLMDITQEYQRLLDIPGMIAQDFAILYPHAKDKLFELWGNASQQILSYCKMEKRALDLLPIQANIPSDSQSQGGGVSGSLRIYQKRLKPRWLLLSSREEQNRFIVKAQVGEETFAEGIALTKRAAREAAAQLALVEIQRRGEQIHSQSQGGGVSGSLRIYQKRLKPRWLLLSSREEQNSSLDSFRPIESLALRQRSSEPLSVIRESV
ncbi:hypothetical protein Q8A67_024936 [Cirrhinus molitorella]|uniref:DRBM domain-containing protein n=1 Tax=Cirrhinus molitorella TaxID=172907 RepID=A0AA88TB06_9TELE|nr:hypothetical protein Q8A67_024936 [Cirrhinus molitorella]